MRDKATFLLIGSLAAERSDLIDWIAYHRLRGVDEIAIYLPRRALRRAGFLKALERAGILRLLPLTDDAGDPLKSAMMLAMLEGEIPDGTLCLGLNCDEFLCLEQGDAASLATSAPEFDALVAPVADWSDDINGTNPAYRTLFHAGPFQGHTGARPITRDAEDGVTWADGTGRKSDPETLFWTDSQNADGMISVEKHPAGKDHSHFEGDTPPDGSRIAAVWPAVAEERKRLLENSDIKAAHDALIAAEQAPPAPETTKAEPVEKVKTAAPDPAPANPYEQDLTAPPAPWFAEIYPGGDRQGFMRSLEHHSLIFIDRGADTLVVTFDNLSNVNDRSLGREPWAYKYLLDEGHSQLGVVARRKDWYREPGLIEALQGMAADGFFKRFRRVVFAGTSMGGFAALAFSSLSPGAHVIAFSPQSTLAEDIVPWEERFGMGRVRNWRLPHSDAAFEIEDAAQVYVISDPYFEPDLRHMNRLNGPNVVKLKAWYSSHYTPVFLRRADLLKPVMGHAIAGTLTEDIFYRLYRERRRLPWYRRALTEAMMERGHETLAGRVGPAFANQSQQTRPTTTRIKV